MEICTIISEKLYKYSARGKRGLRLLGECACTVSFRPRLLTSRGRGVTIWSIPAANCREFPNIQNKGVVDNVFC